MSLDWNLENIKDHETICWVPGEPFENGEPSVRINPITEALIWRTMVVDIGRLTEENVDEFAYRLNFYERVFDKSIRENNEWRFITYEEVRAHIGLITNVANLTRPKWMSHMMNALKSEYGWQADRWLESEKKKVEIPTAV